MRKILAPLVLLFVSTLHAAEGMWPFDAVPAEDIEKRYGFKPTKEWLDHLRLSSVRIGGGSGAFVSKDGLVITNHHVASGSLHKLSTAEKDYIKNGFHAKTHSEEVKVPDLEMYVLLSIEDVTSRVTAAVKPEMSAAKGAEARRAVISQIEKESQKATGLRSDVITFYRGGQYKLYRYKIFNDVRMVFAPEGIAAFFGGDPDNFTFPRYDLDMALYRVYENGQPYRPEHYLKWSSNGAAPDEAVFVSGHPGHTSRILTVGHLESLRDLDFPYRLSRMQRVRKLLYKYSEGSEECARRAKGEIFGIENGLKANIGRFEGLSDKATMRQKALTEEQLRAEIRNVPALQEKYGDAWDAIAKARRELKTIFLEANLIEGGAAFSCAFFGTARALVRLAEENEKPDSERLLEYTEARRERLERGLYATGPYYEDLDLVKLEDSLTFMREQLGSDHRMVILALLGKSPKERAHELIKGSKLRDVEFRRQLAKGGRKAIEESTDPLIMLAKWMDSRARELQKISEAKISGVETENYGKIARALFELKGTKIYPDCTFSLRLSYGEVKGYKEKGKDVPPYTTLGGLFKYSEEKGGKDPYEIPKSWLNVRSSLTPETPFNFVSTNDIIGGNSGSPVVNKNNEYVGLIFDGNIQSLPGDFVYDETMNRAVSVDSRAIIETMRKVYGANKLADEIQGR